MAERESLPDPAVLVKDDTNYPTLFPLPLWISPLVVGQTSCTGPPKLLQVKSKGLAQLKWFSREFKENTLLNWSSLNSLSRWNEAGRQVTVPLPWEGLGEMSIHILLLQKGRFGGLSQCVCFLQNQIWLLWEQCAICTCIGWVSYLGWIFLSKLAFISRKYFSPTWKHLFLPKTSLWEEILTHVLWSQSYTVVFPGYILVISQYSRNLCQETSWCSQVPGCNVGVTETVTEEVLGNRVSSETWPKLTNDSKKHLRSLQSS